MTIPPSPNPPGTLNELFLGAIARYRDRPVAMRWKPAGAGWTPISFQQLLERVRSTSLALANLGVKRGDRIAILSENRPEWAYADLATLCAGALDAPIYPSLTPAQVLYILNDSGAKVIFVSNAAQAAKVAEVRAQATHLEHVVTMDPINAPDAVSLEAVCAEGRRALEKDPQAVRQRAAEAKPEDVATLIHAHPTQNEAMGILPDLRGTIKSVAITRSCCPPFTMSPPCTKISSVLETFSIASSPTFPVS